MPQLSVIGDFLSAYRHFFLIGVLALALLLIAILTLVVAFRRLRHHGPKAVPTVENPAIPSAATPRVQKFRLAVGDIASPWTQGVYERNSPEGKLAGLLMAFAFDEAEKIHRAQHVRLVEGIDLEELLQRCASAGGMAIYGAYATLALWHAQDERYAKMALKVISHAQLAREQKELIRFLFQDIAAVQIKPKDIPSLSYWHNREFRTALALYTATKIKISEWQEMAQVLPASLHRFYELVLAQKLPVRTIYRRARESRIYAEGLLRLNLETLLRYLGPRRWQRLQHSEQAERFGAWLKNLPCSTEAEALLHIANPDVFESADIDDALAQKIHDIIDGRNPRAWLFDGARPPRLPLRLQYFKYFCLFGKYHEAVRCFSLLGVFRRDRAQRLWYARALFLSGMQQEAWAEMGALMVDFPRDAAILNEAGIYAHKLGRFAEAQEIFALARSYFPDDATIAYNEAVFTEQYSKMQIEEKWSRVQKLTQPPVVQG